MTNEPNKETLDRVLDEIKKLPFSVEFDIGRMFVRRTTPELEITVDRMHESSAAEAKKWILGQLEQRLIAGDAAIMPMSQGSNVYQMTAPSAWKDEIREIFRRTAGNWQSAVYQDPRTRR